MDLNQVTIGSTDLRRSEAFYRALGLELIVKDEHYLDSPARTATARSSVDLVDAVADTEAVTVYFEDPDPDALVERLERSGFAVELRPTDMPWLWREARFATRIGRRLCLFRAGENRLYPPWRLP